MKRDEISKLVTTSINELNDALQAGRSDTLCRYLDVMSRFHNYSFGNCLLIQVQRPDATHVAGFQKWKQLGRMVRKGEKGIGILAPIVGRRKDADDRSDERHDQDSGQRSLSGFRAAHVFDVSQTDGKPFPEFAKVTGNPGAYLSRLEDLIREHGVKLSDDYIPGGADGASRKSEIMIRPGLPEAERLTVLAHEFAHELMHHTNDRGRDLSRSVRETEAEAVAYVVCRAVGIDPTTSSSDYIHLYRGDVKLLSESLNEIQRTAAKIIDGLTTETGSRFASTKRQTDALVSSASLAL